MSRGLHGVRVADPALLEILGGFESLCRRFDALLDEHAGSSVAAPSDADPLVVDALLGLVAIRLKLQTVLTAAQSAVPSETSASLVGSEGSWLR